MLLLIPVVLVMACLGLKTAHWIYLTNEQRALPTQNEQMALPAQPELRAIEDEVRKEENLLAIFIKHNLDIKELYAMQKVAAEVYPLRIVHPGRSYTVTVDGQNRIQSFVYRINQDSFLNIWKSADGFQAKKTLIPYKIKLLTFSGTIEDNLVSSIGEDRKHLLLALQLSDIFSWDIDFTTDLRKNDSYRVVVEGCFHNGEFIKYGNIISAYFANDGRHFRAYRFEYNGKSDYYDEQGKALRKAFLKAPLNFRRISSRFSKGRLHPILKIRRPHHGLDYAAPSGTPVSAVGDGTVTHAGWNGAYGNLVIVRHPNGWKTCYGHLSKIAKGIKQDRTVEQGQVIGYVGATGLATGPHLHYEVRVHDRCVNPLKMTIPEGLPIPGKELAAFQAFRNRMDSYCS